MSKPAFQVVCIAARSVDDAGVAFRAAKLLTKALAPHDEEQEILLSEHHTPHHFASVSVGFSSVSDNW